MKGSVSARATNVPETYWSVGDSDLTVDHLRQILASNRSIRLSSAAHDRIVDSRKIVEQLAAAGRQGQSPDWSRVAGEHPDLSQTHQSHRKVHWPKLCSIKIVYIIGKSHGASVVTGIDFRRPQVSRGLTPSNHPCTMQRTGLVAR